jgi:hypothetical protein
MAITKTTSVQRLEVYPASNSSGDAAHNEAHESVMVNFTSCINKSQTFIQIR